jgi:hypothetical protein
MDATAASGASSRAAAESEFGAGRLLLIDSRIAFGVLNHARYFALNRMFGTSREQANVLTAVLAVTAAGAAYESGQRMLRAPLRVSGADMAMGGFVLREAALGVVGPGYRNVPGLGVLVAFAIVGNLGVPRLRRAARDLRAAEQRVRARRRSLFAAASRASRDE